MMHNKKLCLIGLQTCLEPETDQSRYVDVDVVDLRAQADASMPASNNNVNYTIYSNF